MSLASMIQQAQQQQAALLQQQAVNMPTLRQFGDVTITPQNAAQYNTTLGDGDQTGTLPGYQQALDDLIKQMGGSDQMGSQWTNLNRLFQQPGFADKFLSMYPAARNYLPSYLQSGMVQATGADNGYGSLADIAPLILAIGGGALGSAAGAGAEGASAVGAGEGLASAGGTGLGTAGAASAGGGGDVALGAGITAGSTGTGIGGGAIGTGLTAGTSTGAVGGGALGTGLTGAGTALGTFGGESLYPVLGGTASAAGATGLGSAVGSAGAGTTTAAAGAAGGTALSRILDGTASTADYLNLLGTAGATGLGIYGSQQQAGALRDLGNQYLAIGAPSRTRYESSFQPGFTMANEPGYQDALAQTTKATLHGLSVGGNPADSPNAWAQTLSDVNSKFAFPALQSYRNQNASTGGYGAFSTAAPSTLSAAIGADAGAYNALGYGLGNIFSPPTSLEQLLKSVKGF